MKKRRIVDTILSIPKGHFWVYFGCMIISLLLCVAGILINVYLNCELTTTILISLGTGGVTSSLVGYFVELANARRLVSTKQQLLDDVIFKYKMAVKSFLDRFVKTAISVYEYKPLEQPYMIDLVEDKTKIIDLLISWDNTFIPMKNGKIISDKDKNDKKDLAIRSFEPFIQKLTALYESINKLLLQGRTNLLEYFSQKELEYLEQIALDINPTDLTSFELYGSAYEALIDENFCTIININPSDLKYYHYNTKRTLHYKGKAITSGSIDINSANFQNFFN